VHTSSSDDIDLDTLPTEHGESKSIHWVGESARVFTRHTSTAIMPTSSNISIFGSQTDENTSTLPSSDTTIDFDIVSDVDLLIALCKSKHTCTSHPIFCFVSYSHLSSPLHALFVL